MLSQYNVKETALRGLLRLNQTLKHSRGFQANEASDVIDHVLLFKTNQAPIQCFNKGCFVFLYKPRSLGVEHHITSVKNQCLIYCAA